MVNWLFSPVAHHFAYELPYTKAPADMVSSIEHFGGGAAMPVNGSLPLTRTLRNVYGDTKES
jgi:hypothetical protein